jgi:uncharacterized protein involved in exopolysaccharide biosynthesis
MSEPTSVVDDPVAAGAHAARGQAASLDFLGAVFYLLDRKWRIIAFALLCGALGALYAFRATAWYRSEVVMVPVDQESSLSAGLGPLGGLAGLAGIQLGGRGPEEALAMLESRSFAEEFINERNLMPILFAADWDAGRSDWKDPAPDKHPDIRMAVEYFGGKVRTISENKGRGVVTIGMQWKDPQLAADWANDLAARINARLRKQALEEAERNVGYLQREVASTNIVSLQQAMGRVLESEMQKLLMARGSEQFAFKIVDRAVPAHRRFRPQRALLVAMSTIAGGLLAVAFLLVRRTLLDGLRQRSASP